MDDIKAITRRLALSNIVVFVVVLGIFCASVYSFWTNQIAEQERTAISRLTDSVIASIDFEDNKRGLPDLIATDMSENESRALSSLRLQYFDPTGKLLIERGTLKIDTELKLENSLEIQDFPHALVQTKSASYKKKLLGYVRVATPLADSDKMKQTLLTGLMLGLLVALIAAGLGTIWLVRQSLVPIQTYVDRLERFTADAAHELRNPIAIVRTNSEVALKYRENTSKTDIQKFETILDASMQMQKLTEDLLALARGLQAKTLSASSTHSIVEIVKESLASIERSQNNSQVHFDLRIPSLQGSSEKNLQIDGNCDEIKRIIINIAENAVLYSKEDGAVNVTIEEKASAVIVKITDNGIGIAANDLPHIFDRFWRADPARTHHSGGNGLGLSIAATLVRQNGGSIAVTSEIGKGSTFAITLAKSK